jgi:hypothetical protein
MHLKSLHFGKQFLCPANDCNSQGLYRLSIMLIEEENLNFIHMESTLKIIGFPLFPLLSEFPLDAELFVPPISNTFITSLKTGIWDGHSKDQ